MPLSHRPIVRFTLTLAASAALTAAAHATQPTAMDTFVAAARESAKGLPGHTVYRPLHMGRFEPGSVPVIVWANGGCRRSNMGFMIALTTLANHGFVVIANGAHDAPLVDEGTGVKPQNLIDAIDWVKRNDENVRSQFKNRLNINRIGVAGQSCGGLEALVAGGDPRVRSLAAVNTGFFPTPIDGYGREQLVNIHTPTLVVNGGPSDVAYQNSIDNYHLIDAPVYLAENSHAGHTGLWFGIRDGEGSSLMANQGATLLVNWFDYTLNHNWTAGRYFFGASCGLCTQSDWKVRSKNWRR